MKHILPYPILEAKEANPAQQSFLAELRAKLEEFGIPWHNLASPRSQKTGTAELQLSQRDAWHFVQESGWEQNIKPALQKKFKRDLNTVRESGFADEFTERPAGRAFYLYVQSAGMRADDGRGSPGQSPMYKFQDGVEGAKGAFQGWLLRELLYVVNYKKNQLIRATPTPEVLRKYVLDPASDVRATVASSPDLPEDVALQLSRDGSDLVYVYLLDQPTLPAQAMLNLAKSRDLWVRQKLAARPDLTEEVMIRLSRDPNQRVRDAVNSKLHVIQNRELRGYGWSDDDIALARQLGL